MGNLFESINNTSDKATEIGEKYIKDTHEYYRLKIFQQLTISISMVAKALIIGGILFIGLFLLAFAAAYAIGDWLNNVSLGYLIVAGLFLLIAIIVYYNRSYINKKVITKMSPKFFNS